MTELEPGFKETTNFYCDNQAIMHIVSSQYSRRGHKDLTILCQRGGGGGDGKKLESIKINTIYQH